MNHLNVEQWDDNSKTYAPWVIWVFDATTGEVASYFPSRSLNQCGPMVEVMAGNDVAMEGLDQMTTQGWSVEYDAQRRQATATRKVEPANRA